MSEFSVEQYMAEYVDLAKPLIEAKVQAWLCEQIEGNLKFEFIDEETP